MFFMSHGRCMLGILESIQTVYTLIAVVLSFATGPSLASAASRVKGDAV